VPHARSRRRAIRKVTLDDGNTQARSREFPCAGTAYDPCPDNDDVIDHCFEESSRHTYVNTQKLMPVRNGSVRSNCSIVSPVIHALPMILGVMQAPSLL
jgi:hypothetical protein